MRKLLFLLFSLSSITATSQNFNHFFEDKTLRIDYIFAGNTQNQIIALDQLYELPQWAGRKHNLSKNILAGNGQIKVYDLSSGELIYTNSFSTLFQEWLTTTEAITTNRSFENVYLVPFPKEKVRIETSLRDHDGSYKILTSHIVDPKDILIHKKDNSDLFTYSLIHKADKNEKSINIAILAEGYTSDNMDDFRKHAEQTVNQILSYKPFEKYKSNFNFYVVESLSKESGVSVPREGNWKNTAFKSHFDTFYSDRYLTTNRVKDIHNVLAGIPYEHIIILANTNTYGGGGIYNAYTLTTTEHKYFKPVVVHEFGHSFAGLADEYFYENDALNETYSLDQEPWEQNITTLKEFNNKWSSLLPSQTPIPTNIGDSTRYRVGVYEGAGYKAKGIYKSSIDCRMKTNTCQEFCPACQKAIEERILFNIE